MSFITRIRRSPDQEQPTAEDGETPDARPAPRTAVRRVAAWVLTGLACLLVLFALIAPNDAGQYSPAAFVRVPLEGVLGVALVLLLPGRARKPVAVLIGVALGLLTVLKVIDIGFSLVLARPFNLVFDWPLLKDGAQFLTASFGRTGGIGAAVAAGLLAVAVLVLTTLAVLRLTRLVVRRRTTAAGSAAVLGVVWIVCAALGAQILPSLPVAAVASGRLRQLPVSLRDHEKFAKEVAADSYRGTPGDRLLTGLRGKNVVLSFVESYGRDAIENPRFAPEVNAVLDAGSNRLRAGGFASRSAFLTSPTAGGGSWLAHSTLLSGVWIDNQQRYQSLVTGNRFTLTNAFHRAGWRTVGVMPGTTGAWPEAGFYGYDKIYDRWHLGYQGPRFNWGMPPDQFTLASFQRSELATPGHPPVMAEIPLVSSHAPWAPRPSMIDWKNVGDGSVYGPMAAAGDRPEIVWRNPGRVRSAYGHAIAYSLSALISYVETYGDKNLVLVFLGDHQAAPIITGSHASRDVPITIVARDPAVLDQISGWGWQDGLRPSPKAPVWRMNTFRDRFLSAFGPQN